MKNGTCKKSHSGGGRGRKMALDSVVNLIVSNGMSAVVIAYLLIRDWKYNDILISLMSELQVLLTNLNKEKEN